MFFSEGEREFFLTHKEAQYIKDTESPPMQSHHTPHWEYITNIVLSRNSALSQIIRVYNTHGETTDSNQQNKVDDSLQTKEKKFRLYFILVV